MLLNRLLDLSDLIPVFAFESHDVTFRKSENSAPLRQNSCQTSNDTLHLSSVNELPIDAILELFNDLVEEDDFGLPVNEKLTESLSNTAVLL